MDEKSNIKILFIEDDPAICEHFRLAVETHGYAVDIAASGEEGLALVNQTSYDVVAINHQLPDMKGIDVARQLLDHDPGLATTIVTEPGNEALIAEALSIGVLNYVARNTQGRLTELLPSLIAQCLQLGQKLRYAREASTEIKLFKQRTIAAEKLARVGFWEWNETGKADHYCSDELALI